MVINYDVPHDPEDYVHRIGRTARADKDGRAITLVSEPDFFYFSKIEQLLEKSVPRMPLPEGLGEAPEYKQRSPKPSNHRRYHHRPSNKVHGKRKPQGKKSKSNRGEKK